MAQKFKVGDHVTWNSEAGHVGGRIIKVHTNDFDHKGYTRKQKKNWRTRAPDDCWLLLDPWRARES